MMHLLPRFIRRYADRVRMSPVWYRLAKGTFWVFVGTAFSRVLVLVASIVTARILGRESFGNLGIITSTVMMFTIFAGLHMGLTSTKFVAEFRKKDPPKAGRIIGLCESIVLVTSIAVAAIFYLSAPWLAARTLNAPHLTGLLRIASLQLVLEAFNGAQYGTIAGMEAFRDRAIIFLVVGLLAFPIAVGGVILGGINGAVWALVIVAAINIPLCRIVIQKHTRQAGIVISYRESWREWPIIWTFTLPAVLTGITIGPINWVCNAILVNSPDGYAEMGILSAVNQWFGSIVFLPTVIGTALFPTLSERMGAKDYDAMRRMLKILLKMTVLVAGPVVLALAVASPAIIDWYGKEFHGHWRPLVIVLVMGWVYAFQTPLMQVVFAAGRMWPTFWMNVVWAAIFCGGTVALIHWGAAGLLLAKLAAYVVVTSWYFVFAFTILRRKKKVPADSVEEIRTLT
jgi:O-antigen/teichoic acid export membrane protein